MTALATNPSIQALAWALVHFLWQGAAIGVVFVMWLRIGRPGAQARYAAGIAALAALLAAPVTTVAWLSLPGDEGLPVAAETATFSGSASTHALGDAPAVHMVIRPDAEAPDSPARAPGIAAAVIVGAWAVGVLLLSLRLAGGWLLARSLAARAWPAAPADICELAAALSRRLGLARTVRIVESTAVPVPVLVGWMKPVVLFPPAALAGLSPGQVEALIAHELAHVRRHDYLVNILQSIVETLLFYHPAVWCISRDVREAREQCCDDLAVGVCDRVVYISALADLAAMDHPPRLAMATTRGFLLRRVQRLLGHPHESSSPGVAWLGILTLALALGGVVPAALVSRGEAQGQPAQGGVAAGSLAGVAGGVAAGIEGGVPDGVEGGVPGGVEAGIPGGIPGGVAIIPESSDERDRQDPVEAQRRRGEEDRRVREAEARYRELRMIAEQLQRQLHLQAATSPDVRQLEAIVADLTQRVAAARAAPPQQWPDRSDSHDLRSTAQLEARVARAQAEVEAASTELARTRQRHDVGLLPPAALREAEARVASSRRELAALTIEAKAVLEEMTMRDQLDARRGSLQTESRIRQAEADRVAATQAFDAVKRRADWGAASSDDLAEVQARMVAAELRLASARGEYQLAQEELALRQRRTAALARVVRDMDEANARYALRPEGARVAPAVTDSNAQARPGDTLSIEIAGEPALPRDYQVDADGTIRLPLVGSLAVAGLTTQQVREAVTARLNERQLAGGRGVTVTLRRPGGKEE